MKHGLFIIFVSLLVLEACAVLPRDYAYLSALDPAAPAVVLKNDIDDKARAYAANVLGEIKDSRTVEPLIDSLSDTDYFVRGKVIMALGKKKDPRVVVPLIESLNDSDYFVREKAIFALGEIADPRAVAPLIAILKGNDPFLSSCAAAALGSIKDAGAVEPLISERDSPCYIVRKEAARALAIINDEQSGDALMKFLNDQNLEIIGQVDELYSFYVSRGVPGTEDVLIRALYRVRKATMAAYLLNCGNEQLKDAALYWLKYYGFEMKRTGLPVRKKWGVQRKKDAAE